MNEENPLDKIERLKQEIDSRNRGKSAIKKHWLENFNQQTHMNTEKKIERADVVKYLGMMPMEETLRILADAVASPGPDFAPQEKKGYTWEESFCGVGYYLAGSKVTSIKDLSVYENNKNVFRTEKQALSVLAFAQLSHVVHKYNRGIEIINDTASSFGIVPSDYAPYTLRILEIKLPVMQTLAFISHEDAKQSLITNKELWEQYWML